VSADRTLNRRRAVARAEASAWLARLHADDRTRQDELAFQAWIQDDELHRDVFDQLTQVWEMAGAARHRPPAPRLAVQRRRVLLGGLGVGVVAGASVLGVEFASASVSQTRRGEQKRVPLGDGASVLLDTDSRISCHLRGRIRQVTLERGRACFDLAADARPFMVRAKGNELTATDATFDISTVDSSVSFLLLKGIAVLRRSHPMGGGLPLTIATGERVTLASAGSLQSDRPDLAKLVAWHTGRLVFENESLAEAVAEMNRYSANPLRIADPELAPVPISGVYRTGDNLAFAQSVCLLLSTVVRQGPGGELLLRKK
jgi:transmembrane sensor